MNLSYPCVYVLELSDGKYYIGKTTDIAKRFNDHKTGNGSAWTKQHGGGGICKIIDIQISTSLFDEDKYTLEYMNALGIENVRGGSYSNCVLTSEQYNNIVRAIRNANNLCMSCGAANHFAEKCPNFCANYSKNALHYKRYLKKDAGMVTITNEMLEDVKDANKIDKIGEIDEIDKIDEIVEETVRVDGNITAQCSRCYRSNHMVTNCFAKTDLYGNVL